MTKVEEADHPPYQYDGDRIVHIQDVLPDTDAVIEHGLLSAPLSYKKELTMVLINGKGGGTTGDGTFCNDTLSVINVERGKVYRLRLIGGTSVSFNSLAIEGHDNLEVIEADSYVCVYLILHSCDLTLVSPCASPWIFLLFRYVTSTISPLIGK
jgi:L-ascorbate oxidase